MIVRTVVRDESQEDTECLLDRKWWCFLLSSILSFIVGVFSVLFVRSCVAVFSRRPEEYSQSEVKKQLDEERKQRQQEVGQEGGGDFMSEAKDWAGELISGQTGTGRILVSTCCRKIQCKS